MTKKKTIYAKFVGPVKWAKVYEPDTAFGSTRWSIDQYLDNEALAYRKSLGIQSKVKSDENGEYAAYKRDTTKVFNGKINEFHPPIIYNKDGSKAVWYELNEEGNGYVRKGDPVLIGNGSVCEVTVAVYDTMKGKGQRLESVRIIDLIEYVREDRDGFVPNSIEKSDKPAVKTPWD